MSNLKLNHWRERLELFQLSKLSVAAFCREHQVPIHQFYYWREKIAKSQSPVAPALVPVVFEQAPRVLSALELSKLTLRLPNGVEILGIDTDRLRELLPQIAQL